MGVESSRPKAPRALDGLGSGIRKLRKARGWSQARLSQEAAISPSNLSNYEQQKHYPSTLTLGRMLDALESDLAALGAAMADGEPEADGLISPHAFDASDPDLLLRVIARLESRTQYLEALLRELMAAPAVAGGRERRI
jgi:transcriptional regulator with XRE-family HTH domain